MSLWVSLFLLCNRLVEYFNIYQLSICFSNVVVALLDGKLGGLSSRGRLSAEPLLDCSTLDPQGGLRLVRLLLLLTWPAACWPWRGRNPSSTLSTLWPKPIACDIEQLYWHLKSEKCEVEFSVVVVCERHLDQGCTHILGRH